MTAITFFKVASDLPVARVVFHCGFSDLRCLLVAHLASFLDLTSGSMVSVREAWPP